MRKLLVYRTRSWDHEKARSLLNPPFVGRMTYPLLLGQHFGTFRLELIHELEVMSWFDIPGDVQSLILELIEPFCVPR